MFNPPQKNPYNSKIQLLPQKGRSPIGNLFVMSWSLASLIRFVRLPMEFSPLATHVSKKK